VLVEEPPRYLPCGTTLKRRR